MNSLCFSWREEKKRKEKEKKKKVKNNPTVLYEDIVPQVQALTALATNRENNNPPPSI